ncbi:MAG TPA: outer membrane protein assembly factor BamA [Candidatus Omnitrophota bacterium]|nr:outer membrane protein assembly factor BamA [Candidatus Omnitrophota bacterium]
MKRIVLAALFVMSLVSFGIAQEESSQVQGQAPEIQDPAFRPEAFHSESGKIVKAVDIQGNKTIGMTTILSRIKTRVGDAYSSNIISDDIKRLYNTGYFSDITVEAENVTGGLRVKINLAEKPVIKKITFSKTRYYSARSLELKIKSKKGRFFDRRNLKEDERIIKELYSKKGLTNATVEIDTEIDAANNGATLHYIVKEGERVKIKKINFAGNTTFKYKRLMKVIKTRPDGIFNSGYLKEDILEEDMLRLKAFYASEGFLDATARYDLENAPRSRLLVNVQISEGKRYYVGNLMVEGDLKILTKEEIFKIFKELKEGGVFTQEKLEKDIADISSAYFDKGYIFADARESTSINSQTGKVDVRIDIKEGEIAYVNKVKVEGNSRTRDIVIRREVRLNPGDTFDGTKLRRTKERLKNLGYFEEINYDIQDTQYPNQKDLVVQVKESKTGSLSFGGGYSTVDQLVGFIEVQQKNFDFTNWPSFTGGGQSLTVRGEVGSIRNNAILSFTEPWIFDMPISGGFDLYRSRISRESDVGYAYDEARTGFDLRFGKELSEYLSANTIYRLEEIKIDNFADGVSSELTREGGKNKISSLGFGLTHDSRDDVFNPTKGLLLGGTFDLAGGALGGDKDFYRLKIKGSYDIPLAGGSVLEYRLRAGVVDSYGDSSYVPIYERFFAGGAYTIRGYNERKVGPLDPASKDPIGGDSMLVNNIEYIIPVIDFIKVAIFFDSGNVWPKIGDFGNGGFKSGTGLGLRVKTPIGPINLDYGYPLNDEPGEDERSGKFYFSISRSF